MEIIRDGNLKFINCNMNIIDNIVRKQRFLKYEEQVGYMQVFFEFILWWLVYMFVKKKEYMVKYIYYINKNVCKF